MDSGDVVRGMPPSSSRHRPSPSPKYDDDDASQDRIVSGVRDEANFYVHAPSTASNGRPTTTLAAKLPAKSPFSTLERVSPVPSKPVSSSSSPPPPTSRSPEKYKTMTVSKIRSPTPFAAEQPPGLRHVSTAAGSLQVSPAGSTLHAPYSRATTVVGPGDAVRLASPQRHAATLPVSTTTSRSKSPRIRREKKEKKIGHRRVDRNTGQVSYKRFPTNELMGALQEGIRQSISVLSSQKSTDRDVLFQDFAVVENIFHPSAGSATTIPHPYADFRFKTYAPVAFRYFRNLFDIKTDDYLSAICDKPLIEITNPGASGSIFYITDDGLFILKTVQAKEAEFLQRLLAGYFLNLSQNSRTLLPKFFGIYCYQSLGKNVRVLAMNNIFPRQVKMHEKYDLKGSTFGRKASKTERAKSCPTYKDLDFLEFHPDGIIMEPDTYQQVMKTIRRDCAVLESFKIMDYSLLIGIHNVDEAERQAMEAKTEENTQQDSADAATGKSAAQQAAAQARQAAELNTGEVAELFSPRGSKNNFNREPPVDAAAPPPSSSRTREAKLTRHQSVHRERLAAFPNERSSQDDTPLSRSGKPSQTSMKLGGRSIPEASDGDEVDAADDDGDDYETDATSDDENEVDVEGAGENSDDDVEPVNVADYPDAVDARNANGDRLVLFMGIIDILQNYRFLKKFEHSFKSVLYDGKTVSVCHPTFYAQRFQDFMAERVLRAQVRTAPSSPNRTVSQAESTAVSEDHVQVGIDEQKEEKEHRRSLRELLGDVSYNMPGVDERGLQPPHVADEKAAAEAAGLAAHAAEIEAQATQEPAQATVATTSTTRQEIYLPTGQHIHPQPQQQQDTGSSSGYYSSLRSNATTASSKPRAVIITTTKAVGQATAEPPTQTKTRSSGKTEKSPVHDVTSGATTTTSIKSDRGGEISRQISTASSRDAVRKQKQEFFMPTKPPRMVGHTEAVTTTLQPSTTAAVQPKNSNGSLDADSSTTSTSSSSSSLASPEAKSPAEARSSEQANSRASGNADAASSSVPARDSQRRADYARLDSSSSPSHTNTRYVTTVNINSHHHADLTSEQQKKKKDSLSSFAVSSSAAAAPPLSDSRSLAGNNKRPILYPDASPLYVRKEFSIPSTNTGNNNSSSSVTTRTTRGDNIITTSNNNTSKIEQQKVHLRDNSLSMQREQYADKAARLPSEMGDGKKQ